MPPKVFSAICLGNAVAKRFKGAAVKVLRYPSFGRDTSRRGEGIIKKFAGPAHPTVFRNVFYAIGGITYALSEKDRTAASPFLKINFRFTNDGLSDNHKRKRRRRIWI